MLYKPASIVLLWNVLTPSSHDRKPPSRKGMYINFGSLLNFEISNSLRCCLSSSNFILSLRCWAKSSTTSISEQHKPTSTALVVSRCHSHSIKDQSPTQVNQSLVSIHFSSKHPQIRCSQAGGLSWARRLPKCLSNFTQHLLNHAIPPQISITLLVQAFSSHAGDGKKAISNLTAVTC